MDSLPCVPIFTDYRLLVETLRRDGVAHACNSSNQKAEAGGLPGVEASLCYIQDEFQVILGYRVRSCLFTVCLLKSDILLEV